MSLTYKIFLAILGIVTAIFMWKALNQAQPWESESKRDKGGKDGEKSYSNGKINTRRIRENTKKG